MNKTTDSARTAGINARGALLEARAALESAIRDLDRYIERLDVVESPREKSRVMNHALSALACGIMPNLRLDLIADAQAELVRAAD